MLQRQGLHFLEHEDTAEEFEKFEEIVGGPLEILECGPGLMMVANLNDNLRERILDAPPDGVWGTHFVIGYSDGKFTSLTDEQIKKVKLFARSKVRILYK